MKMRLIVFSFLFGFVLLSCQPKKPENIKEPEKQNPNIILMIGDGMGLSQLSSVYYDTPNRESVFSKFPKVALVHTSSLTHKITDSGAAATAMATGKRTANRMISVDTNGIYLKPITDILKSFSYQNGLIATSSITHATPAAFYAHQVNRKNEEAIAAFLPKSSIDFVAAGGYAYFDQGLDKANYLDSLRFYNFYVDTNELRLPKELKPDDKIAFLLEKGAMPSMLQGRGDFLPKALSTSLDYFARVEKPFFLMVEGSQIDWAGHDNDTSYLFAEMRDFEKAVEVAMDFAEKEGNTIVIVTADHETGGFALASHDTLGYNHVHPKFATDGHSATLVPLLTYAPGSICLEGIVQNTDIFNYIFRVGTLQD